MSGLLGGKPKTPTLPPPAPMPVPLENDENRRKKMQQLAARQAASGRSSTYLSDSGTSDKLGG